MRTTSFGLKHCMTHSLTPGLACRIPRPTWDAPRIDSVSSTEKNGRYAASGFSGLPGTAPSGCGPKRRERLTHLHIYEDAFVPGDSQCELWIGLRFLSGHSADLPVYDWLPHRCEFWMVWTIREDRTYVDDDLCPTAIAFINSTFLAGLTVLRHCPAFPVTCIAYK